MGNLVLSILILGGFCGFLLVMAHLGIRQLLKGYKLDKQAKEYNGTRQGHQSKPIYILRDQDDSIYDSRSVQEWQDMGVLSSAKRRTYPKEFKDNRETNS